MNSRFTKKMIRLFARGLMGTSFLTWNANAQTALTFDSSQFVRTPVSPVTGNSARTVEAWIKTANLGTAQMVIADWGEAANGQRFSVNLFQGNKLSVDVGNSVVSGTTTLNDNAWHHIGVAYDPAATNKVILYVDNSIEATGNFSTAINTSSTIPLRIGVRVDTANYFKGAIDEVRIYNYARSLTQFTTDSQSYCSAQTGLISYYKLNEGIPNGTNTSNTIATDYSGANNDGLLDNFGLSSSSASNWSTGVVVQPTAVTPTITVSKLPTGAVCAGTSVTFSAATTFEGTAPTYQWKVNSTIVGTNSSTYSYIPANGDVVSCTLTSSIACVTSNSVSASTTMTVNSLPTITVSPANPKVCLGSGIVLTAGGAVTYSWSPSNDLNSSTGSTVTSTPTTAPNYTITGTDANGCVGSTTQFVALNGLPVVSVSTSKTPVLCAGDSVRLTGTGADTYSWSPATGLSGTIVTAKPTTTTTYVVTGTNTSTGCFATASKTVTINPLPAAPTVTSPVLYCKNATPVALSATGTNLNWYTVSSGGTSSSTITPATTSAGSSIYYVTQTSSVAAGGCESPRTPLTVTVNPLPTITVSPANPKVCLGSGIVLTASGAVTYSWSPSNDLNTSTGSTVTSTPTTAANYTITGTDANGCVGSTTQFVVLNGLPVVSVSTSKTPILCAGDSVRLTGTGADTYSWSPATGLSSTSSTLVTAKPTATTTYVVTGTSTSTGCFATASKTVTINPLPAAPTVTSPVLYCKNATPVALSATGTNLNWYTVSSGGTSSSTITPATTSAGSSIYYVTQTSSVAAGGCESPRTPLTVTVNPLPTISVSPANAKVCLGSGIVLTASGAVTYSWSPATYLNTTTGSTVTSTPLTSPNYTITGTDANGCVGSITRSVTLNGLPVVSVSTSKTPVLCAGDSVSLSGNGADTYSWSPATGLSSTSSTLVTAKPTATTTYVVTGTSTSTGCFATASKTVTINPLPNVTISSPATIVFCGGAGSTTLIATGATSYLWSPATGLSSTTAATVTASPSSNTVYTVTGTDGNGCVNSAATQILVRKNPALSIAATGPTTICDAAVVPLTASSDSLVTYSWTPTTGLSSSTGANVLATPHTTTTYTVTGTGIHGCTGSATITITVKPRPTVSVAPSGTSAICVGSSITLTASGASTYNWTPSTALSSTNAATVSASPTITTSYKVYGTATNGCIDSFTKVIVVNPLPVVSIYPFGSSTICEGSSITLTATGATTYAWSPSTGLSSTSGASVVASPTTTTAYTVLATNSNGCQASASKTITVNPAPDAAIVPVGNVNICQDDTVFFSALPGFVNYDWKIYGVSVQSGPLSTFATVTGGFYTVTVTNGVGCTSTTSAQAIITVTQHPLPKIKANGTTLDAGLFTSYQWYLNGVAIPGATGRTVVADSSGGYYTVSVTDTSSLHCAGTSENFHFASLGLNNISLTNQGIKLYPNPTKTVVQIESKISVSALVFGMDGKMLWQGENVKQIDMSSFPDGVYRVVIRDQNGGYLGTEKMIKMER